MNFTVQKNNTTKTQLYNSRKRGQGNTNKYKCGFKEGLIKQSMRFPCNTNTDYDVTISVL